MVLIKTNCISFSIIAPGSLARQKKPSSPLPAADLKRKEERSSKSSTDSSKSSECKSSYFNREVKQNLLSNVPAADSHPNYYGISHILSHILDTFRHTSFLLDTFNLNWLCNVVHRLEGFA